MKKLALVLDSPSYQGGMEIAADRIARLLSARYEVHVIGLYKTESGQDVAGRVETRQMNGYTLHEVHSSGISIGESSKYVNYNLFKGILHVCQDVKADIVVSFYLSETTFMSTVAAKQLSIPSIVSARGSDLYMNIFGEDQFNIRYSLENAEGVVYINKSAQSLAQKLFNVTCKTAVIPIHTSPAYFTDKEVHIPGLDGLVIGCHGIFRRIKGIDNLFSAFKAYSETAPATLLMAGEFKGSEREYYVRKMEELGIKDRTIVTGLIPYEDVLNYLRLCDILVVASLDEGGPNSLLESMLTGRAVITSPVGFVPEVVENGKDGIVISRSNAINIEAAIRQLAASPEMRSMLGKNAREKIVHEFTPEKEQALWFEFLGRFV